MADKKFSQFANEPNLHPVCTCISENSSAGLSGTFVLFWTFAKNAGLSRLNAGLSRWSLYILYMWTVGARTYRTG